MSEEERMWMVIYSESILVAAIFLKIYVRIYSADMQRLSDPFN